MWGVPKVGGAAVCARSAWGEIASRPLASSAPPKRRRHAVPQATLHLDGQFSAPPSHLHWA